MVGAVMVVTLAVTLLLLVTTVDIMKVMLATSIIGGTWKAFTTDSGRDRTAWLTRLIMILTPDLVTVVMLPVSTIPVPLYPCP
jgi:hypothetical protein